MISELVTRDYAQGDMENGIGRKQRQMDKPTLYQIRVKGHLDVILAEWFDGLAISNQENGEAVLSGRFPDQAALQGVLKRISNLGLILISVNAVEEKD